MNFSLPIAKINGKTVRGQAHIQPGVNSWIGICVINNHLLKGDLKELEYLTIEYEGPFNCRKFHTRGKGKARILAVSQAITKNQVTITFEGIDEPKLEKRLKKDLKHSYNENLPVYINKKRPSN
jgi:hypothetical protein